MTDWWGGGANYVNMLLFGDTTKPIVSKISLSSYNCALSSIFSGAKISAALLFTNVETQLN